MKITCFGPRGGIPSPSRAYDNFRTDKYGGNTSCYYIEAGPFRIIIDNGSGVSVLGDKLMRDKQFGDFIVLQSHYHWDHVQGMPFSIPYFVGNNRFHIHGHMPILMQTAHNLEATIESVLKEHQATPHFPVAFEAMPSKKISHSHQAQFPEKFAYSITDERKYQKIADASWFDKDADILIKTVPLNHPDGCLGFVIEYKGERFAYCSDNEPFAYTNHRINTICKDVDLIILDGQYSDAQLSLMSQGFGHGSPSLCIKQAIDCGAKNLWIHHHDPKNDDKTIDEMDKILREQFCDIPLLFEFVKEGSSFGDNGEI